MEYLPLLGIAIVILGFALKLNPIAIVIGSTVITGLLGGLDFIQIFGTIGKSFVANRNMSNYILILPVIALLEKNGLRETAAKLINKIKTATPGKILVAYSALRSLLAVNNVGLGGVAGFVRPVVYPMALASINKDGNKITPEDDDTLKGLVSSAENVTWFFGQVLFLGGSGLLLVEGVLKEAGYTIDLAKAVAAEIPVFICALIIACVFYTYKSNKIMKKYTK